MAKLKELPVGIDDFSRVQEKGRYLYVDKTPQIARMILSSSPHVFLARPRRFGKTLLVSTLESLFRGEQGKFRRTWLHQNWDWQRNVHPVLRLNMTLRNRRDAESLQGTLKRRLWRLGGTRARSMLDPEMHADEMLTVLLEDCVERAGREVVVLVDEYDTPITENLERSDVIEDILDELRAFYGALKDNSGLIRFTLVTGITRFARVGLFSGANHLRDLSFHPRASDLVGFTQQDLEDESHTGLRPLIEAGARNMGWKTADLYRALEDHYNGYQFAKRGQPVYNPFSLINCLDDLCAPEMTGSMTISRLPNYWADSGSPKLLFRLLESGAYSNATHFTDDPDVVEEVKYDVRRPNFAALLYQAGYLTRKESGDSEMQSIEWRLDFPNVEVAQTFKQALVNWQQERLSENSAWDTARFELAQALYDAVEKQSVSGLHAGFNTLLRASHHFLHPPPLSSRRDRSESAWRNILDYEIHYQVLLHGAFALMGMRIYGELPTVAGRIDIALEVGGRIVIIELKVDRHAEAAVRQALAGDYPALFATRGRPVTVFGININTRSRSVSECAKWELGFYDMSKGRWHHEPFAVPLSRAAALSDSDKAKLVFQAGLANSAAKTAP